MERLEAVPGVRQNRSSRLDKEVTSYQQVFPDRQDGKKRALITLCDEATP
jgi:hypothetical protein